MEEQNIVDTENGLKNGQDKCPKCGSTDISLNSKNAKLRCNFCRHEFEPEKTEGWVEDISNLTGEVIGSGAKNIEVDAQNIMTFKCTSCGAEVVIDTEETTQARCHWCRNTLSVNEQIPNGAVPDVVLPFKIDKKSAKEKIEKFVSKRKFYANPKFKQEFTTDNVMGVYLPYMIVDMNSHASFSGEGEEKIRSYTVRRGDSEETYYDANLYAIEREFDLTIEGLTVESSSDKLDKNSNKTNNIINSIMPFDTENCVKWNANYLKGYSSEKRDTNIDDLKPLVERQARDIARFAANESLKKYDRGVRWDNQNLEIKGKQWKTSYLPVWLYSYKEEKKNGQNLLHYVASNARTGETIGSIPIHMPKLLAMSALVEVFSFFGKIGLDIVNNGEKYNWLTLSAGLIFFGMIYSKYRNKGARHSHENETKRNISNLLQKDTFIKKKTRLSNSTMDGANNRSIEG